MGREKNRMLSLVNQLTNQKFITRSPNKDKLSNENNLNLLNQPFLLNKRIPEKPAFDGKNFKPFKKKKYGNGKKIKWQCPENLASHYLFRKEDMPSHQPLNEIEIMKMRDSLLMKDFELESYEIEQDRKQADHEKIVLQKLNSMSETIPWHRP